MSEKSARPARMDDIGWRTSGTPTWPATDPGSSVRANGWAEDQIPGSDEFNWLQEGYGDILEWIESMVARQWTTMLEAISNGSYRDLFRITIEGSTLVTRLDEIFATTGTGTGGGIVSELCGDGEQLYYLSQTGPRIVAADPDDLAELWETSALTAGVSALAADGLSVYASQGSGTAGLSKFNRATGAFVTNAGSEYGMTLLRANGVYCCGISPNSGAGKIVFYTVATPTETGTVDTGSSQLQGIAIDEDSVYVGGNRNTYDVWSYSLSARTNNWQVTLPTSTAPTIAAICTDGDFVYVASDRVALTAGGNANLFVLERTTGSLLWTSDIGSSADLVLCDVDAKYLYVVDDSADMFSIRLRAPIAGVVATQSGCSDSLYCDGISIYCQDQGATTDVRRLNTLTSVPTFVIVAGDDPRRKPFYNLAIPIDGRI